MNYTPPTEAEILRVDEYRDRLKAKSCTHPTVFTSTLGSTLRCGGDCGRPLQFLSDIQIENLRGKRPSDAVLDDILRQMDRGGVRFFVDDHWREVRFTAHPLPGFDGSGKTEYACMPVEEVTLLLRASEAP